MGMWSSIPPRSIKAHVRDVVQYPSTQYPSTFWKSMCIFTAVWALALFQNFDLFPRQNISFLCGAFRSFVTPPDSVQVSLPCPIAMERERNE